MWIGKSEVSEDRTQLPESFYRSCNKILIALRSLQTSSCRSWGYPRGCGHHESRCWDQADLCGAFSSGFSRKRSKVFLFVRELAGRCLLMGKLLLWDLLYMATIIWHAWRFVCVLLFHGSWFDGTAGKSCRKQWEAHHLTRHLMCERP